MLFVNIKYLFDLLWIFAYISFYLHFLKPFLKAK